MLKTERNGHRLRGRRHLLPKKQILSHFQRRLVFMNIDHICTHIICVFEDQEASWNRPERRQWIYKNTRIPVWRVSTVDLLSRQSHWWVRIRKSLKIINHEESLIALIVEEGSHWISEKLDRMQNIIQMLMSDRFQEVDSLVKGFTFDSIRFDLYNRFAEKVSILPTFACSIHIHETFF